MTKKTDIKYPLKVKDCLKLCPDLHFLLYNQIGDNLPNVSKILLFFMVENERSGHYCLILQRPGVIEFFDSYGELPDGQHKHIDRRRLNYRGYPPLSRILEKKISQGYKVDYMSTQLQADGAEIATCGRWCCLRAVLNNMSNDDFAALILKASQAAGLTTDELATDITNKFL